MTRKEFEYSFDEVGYEEPAKRRVTFQIATLANITDQEARFIKREGAVVSYWLFISDLPSYENYSIAIFIE